MPNKQMNIGSSTTGVDVTVHGDITANNLTVATPEKNGLMSSFDKGKIDKVIPNRDAIELYGQSVDTPYSYIDFHWGGANTDFTSRIIETDNGVLQVQASDFKTTGTINGLRIVTLTEAEYTALATKDSKTLYIVTG